MLLFRIAFLADSEKIYDNEKMNYKKPYIPLVIYTFLFFIGITDMFVF